ncbi:MAG: hypothetical protein LAP38_15545 [Acidobacteriia bacterium]|nr:hypothetical protein [Terriglobia bacterium]
MTRKLIALDLLLLAVVALLAVQVRREWLAAKTRDHAVLAKKINATPAQPLAPLPKPEPLTAAAYEAVAGRNLFSKDRSSNVIIDVTPPLPPKPVPPFPVAHGVMLWEGVPPTVVLSENVRGAQKGYHPGDTIGQWQIVSVDNQYLVLQWDGKEFKKRLDELLDKTTLVAEAPAAGSAPVVQTSSAPLVQSFSSKTSSGPGEIDMGGGVKACVAGDTAPAGAVVGGLKKVVSATPFGSVCRWEPVK